MLTTWFCYNADQLRSRSGFLSAGLSSFFDRRGGALCVYGRTDPFLPVEHGLKWTEIIPGAQAVWVEGVGQNIPAAYNEVVVDSILANLEHDG